MNILQMRFKKCVFLPGENKWLRFLLNRRWKKFKWSLPFAICNEKKKCCKWNEKIMPLEKWTKTIDQYSTERWHTDRKQANWPLTKQIGYLSTQSNSYMHNWFKWFKFIFSLTFSEPLCGMWQSRESYFILLKSCALTRAIWANGKRKYFVRNCALHKWHGYIGPLISVKLRNQINYHKLNMTGPESVRI